VANSLKGFESQLDVALREPMKKLKFAHAERLIFRNQNVDKVFLVRFPTRWWNKAMWFNMNAAIRFDAIETLLGNIDPLCPTVMMPIHLLRPQQDYLQWRFSIEELDRIIETVVDNIKAYVLPFFEKLDGIEKLKSQLLHEIERNKWASEQRARFATEAERTSFNVMLRENEGLRLVLDPMQRLEKLAAIYVAEGNKDLARSAIDSALAEIEDTVPQVRQAGRRRSLEKLAAALGLK
jgi:hypothetical protein